MTGTVTNSVTGQAIKKASVTLHGLLQRNAYVVISDAEGRFRAANVEPDTYLLTAECPGFTPVQVTSPSLTVVAEEQAVTGASVKLTPLGVITGKVVNEDGEPLPRVGVQAMQVNYYTGARRMNTVRSVQTDDRGEYRLYDLQVGRYFVLASFRNPTMQQPNVRNHSDLPEQSYPATFFPGAADLAGATPTAMAPGAEISGIDFHLHNVRVYHIRGKAVDAQSHEAVHGVSVMARLCGAGLDNAFAGQLGVQLQPDGTFDFPGAVPGLYCVSIQQMQAGHSSFAQQTANVAEQDVNDVVLSVSPGLEIPGTLLFESPPPANFKNFQVTLSSVSGNGNSPNAVPKPDNSFVLQDVFPMVYQLQQMPLPPGFYLKSIHYGDHDVSDGRINVTATGTPLTLVLASDAGQVSVTVQAADGTPASRVTVTLAPENGRRDLYRLGYSGPNGVAMVDGVAPGDYRVFAWEKIDYGLQQIPEFLKLLESRSVRVTVQANGRQSVQTQLISAESIDEAKSKLE